MVPPASSDVLSHSVLSHKEWLEVEESVGAGVGCGGVKNHR